MALLWVRGRRLYQDVFFVQRHRRYGCGADLCRLRSDPLPVESREIEVAGIGEVLDFHAAQGGEDALRAPGVRALPVSEHLLDGDALHVVLRATELAGDD